MQPMKYILPFFLFLSTYSFAQPDSIFVDGMYRKFLVHLPTGYDGSSDLSLVLGFHGGFGNAEQFEGQSLLSEKADESNFIVIYPDGLGFLAAPNFHYWNAGICCGYPYINDIDDVNFIRNLIDHAVDEYAIDENRVYATGMSNGAFMSYRLACELSDKIAAIAPVAGGMVVESCDADRPVPVIHFHSYLDENIPYLGGVGGGVTSHHNPPLDSVMNVWAAKGSCDVLNDTVYHEADYTFVRWNSCDCEAEVNYYITADGGHSWPGGTSTALGDDVSETLNANDLMWEFFQKHTLVCATASVEENDIPEFMVSPNPAVNLVRINSPRTFNELTIRNMLGQTVRTISQLETKSLEVNIENIPEGIYIVSIVISGKSYSQRLIIE